MASRSELRQYHQKRNFTRTQEPRGRLKRKTGDLFVIHKHAARRLHYDLRLELDGVLKSWAVTRGPSLSPNDKRLAVRVEDHPLDYAEFEGRIPEGEYGAGSIIVWDRGRWSTEGDPHKQLAKGHLIIDLSGSKLKGRWHLVHMRGRDQRGKENWLMIKAEDEYATAQASAELLEPSRARSRPAVPSRTWPRARSRSSANRAAQAGAASRRTLRCSRNRHSRQSRVKGGKAGARCRPSSSRSWRRSPTSPRQGTAGCTRSSSTATG